MAEPQRCSSPRDARALVGRASAAFDELLRWVVGGLLWVGRRDSGRRDMDFLLGWVWAGRNGGGPQEKRSCRRA
jgi:hypothetical protein